MLPRQRPNLGRRRVRTVSSDGQTLWSARYASDGEAPTLYHSREIDDIYEINPNLVNFLGRETRIIVSEPVGRFSEMWELVPQSTGLQVKHGSLDLCPFVPTLP